MDLDIYSLHDHLMKYLITFLNPQGESALSCTNHYFKRLVDLHPLNFRLINMIGNHFRSKRINIILSYPPEFDRVNFSKELCTFLNLQCCLDIEHSNQNDWLNKDLPENFYFTYQDGTSDIRFRTIRKMRMDAIRCRQNKNGSHEKTYNCYNIIIVDAPKLQTLQCSENVYSLLLTKRYKIQNKKCVHIVIGDPAK